MPSKFATKIKLMRSSCPSMLDWGFDDLIELGAGVPDQRGDDGDDDDHEKKIENEFHSSTPRNSD